MEDENFSFSMTPIDPKKAEQKPPKNIEIPLSKVSQGIELCKQNVADFVCDARNIMKQGKLYHAYVSFQFALEEFGKIMFIKEALLMH